MHSTIDQLTALQRMAVFSARLRGHELGEWRSDVGDAFASCVHCGREVRIYYSPFQPDMDGPALQDGCMQRSVEAA